MKRVILSIIVPAYNVENYIMELLDSIYKSNVEEKFELLIVDDGATDNTLKIVETSEYGRRDSLKIIRKENGGHGSCVNYAYKMAKGKYLRVIDGDDWINSNAFKVYIDRLEHSDSDMIIDSYSKYFVETKRSEKHTEVYDILGNYQGPIEKALEKLSSEYLLMPMITIKTQIYAQQNKLIDEFISYDDAEYNALCIAASNTIEICNFDIYQYRIGREGQSTDIRIAAKKTDNLIKVINYVLDIIEDSSQEVKARYLERYISKTAANCIIICMQARKVSDISYENILEIDRAIAKKNINVYKLMGNKQLYGKKIYYFRKFKRLFYYVYCLIER